MSQVLNLLGENQQLLWNLWVQEGIVVFAVLSFKAVGSFTWSATEVHGVPPETPGKSSYKYHQATIPWTQNTQKFKKWKSQEWAMGINSSFISSQLPRFPHGCLPPYLLPPHPRLALRAAGTVLIWPWRGRPGPWQMPCEDKGSGQDIHFHLSGGHKATPTAAHGGH